MKDGKTTVEDGAINAMVDDMALNLADSPCSSDKLLTLAVISLQVLYAGNPEDAVKRMTGATACLLTQRALAIRAERRGEMEVVA